MVLVGTIGTSVVEMPLGEEAETAVMVTVWVCTRGGCGWEHSPVSDSSATRRTATNSFYTMHILTKPSSSYLFSFPPLRQPFHQILLAGGGANQMMVLLTFPPPTT